MMVPSKELLKRSEKLKKKKKVGRAVISFVVVFLAGWGLWYFLHSPAFTIQKVVVVGPKSVDSKEVEKVVWKKLNESFFYFLPYKNIFIAPRTAIENNLKQEFTRFDEIRVRAEGRTTLVVDIVEREAYALWCRLNSKDEECYFADNTGYLYSKAPHFSANIFFAIHTPLDTEPLGKRFLKPEMFRRMINLEVNLANLFRNMAGDKFYVVRTELKDLTDSGEANVIIRNRSDEDQEWKILFERSEDSLRLVERLASIFSSESFVEEERSSVNGLEYMDVRFGNKVFYKMR